jgi:hypothetical protein
MNKNQLIKPNPKLGDESQKRDQHGELDDKYKPEDKDSFIESLSSVVNDLSTKDYGELFNHIKDKVESMRNQNKSGINEIRRIIRKELTSLLEAEVKKVDLKNKMKSVLNMSSEDFEQEYGGVEGVDYAIENFDEFKKWLSKQSNLDTPTSTSSGGVDIRSAIKTFKNLPSLKKDFERDMGDKEASFTDKREYEAGKASLKEIGQWLYDQGVDINPNAEASIRRYIAANIYLPKIKRAMEKTGKKYKIDLFKLVMPANTGFGGWFGDQFKLSQEDKEKDWEMFLYNVIGKKLHKEIMSGELERFKNSESKQKVNAALHNFMKTDSELKKLFDEEYAAYHTEVDPEEFDSEEFLHNWFLNTSDENYEEKNIVLNGAYETIVDMLDSGDDSLFNSKRKESEHEEELENISESLYESLRRKKLILK